MREIEINYTNVRIDEVVVELARYVEQGYRIKTWKLSSAYGYEEKYIIELVKY